MKEIYTLAPLHGGQDRYLASLAEMISWVKRSDYPNRIDFAEWARKEYDAGLGTVSGYYQTIAKLGAVRQIKGNGIIVTPFGEALLTAPYEKRAMMIFDKIAHRYAAFLDILEIYAESKQSIHFDELVLMLMPKFPRWKTESPYQERIGWLLSLDCLRQVDKSREYEISEFGYIAYQRLIGDAFNIDVFNKETDTKDTVTALIRELRIASTDGANSVRLEETVAFAFKILGFKITRGKASGDTDIIADAIIGSNSYRIIIDTKARSSGQLQEIDPFVLQEHQAKHSATYIVIVAPNFAGGRLQRQAKKHNIILVTVDLLIQWLEIHNRIPMNLLQQQVMFSQSGLADKQIQQIKAFADMQQRRLQLLIDIVDVVHEAYEREPDFLWSSEQLHTAITMRKYEMRYTLDEIDMTLNFMRHPIIGGVDFLDNRISLLMNEMNLLARLSSLHNKNLFQ